VPANGYIITGRGRASDRLLNNFKVGSKVDLQINTTPNYDNITTAIGGGSLLVKDGKVSDFKINIKGEQPRTALGITRDKKELIMVTIDGRDTSFKGVSQETMAEIMISLGAYEAINFDGGGSTTMAISPLGEDKPIIVNRPSDGGERKIVNGLGIFSTAPQRSLDYIKVLTDDTKMFTNTTRTFYIKGYDKFHNPVDIDVENAIFTVEGIKGEFKGNVLSAKEAGVGKVSAKYKGISADLQINVLDNIADIQLSTDKIAMDASSQKSLGEVYGKNKDGYVAKIEARDIVWSIVGDVGTIKDGILYSTNKSVFGAISATVGKAIDNILVSVGYQGTPLEGFENINAGKFLSYPQAVTGSVNMSNERKEGNYSLKLSYDFTNSDDTRAAYVLLGEKGLQFNHKSQKLGMWVYGNESSHWVRGKIIDSSNTSYNIDFANSIDWKGWKWVTANIPSQVTYPLTLERVYITQVNPLIKDKGEVLFDGLQALYPTSFEALALPLPTKIVDEKQKPVEVKENGYRFTVSFGVDNLDNLLKYHISNKIKDHMNQSDLGIVMGNMNSKTIGQITVPKLEIKGGFANLKHKDTVFIQLDNLKGGIRAFNPEQWLWLKNDLSKATEKNIVLLLPKPVFGSDGFVDKLEADLLHETLSEFRIKGKNIWVITGGKETDVDLKDGIRYIKMASQEVNTSDILNLKYIRFTVNNGDMTYEILPIFGN